MSERKKRESAYASSEGRVVDDDSGRRVWDGTIRTIKLSLMKTGIFQFPDQLKNAEAQNPDSPPGSDVPDPDDWSAESDESGFDPYNSSE